MTDLSNLSDDQLFAIAGISQGANNAGNLRAPNGGFQTFDSPQAGVDAMKNDLLAKVNGTSGAMKSAYGEGYTPTISNLLNVYAPPSENDTQNYINFVSKNSGIDPNQSLTSADVEKIMPHMITMEHGAQGAKQYADSGQTMNDGGAQSPDLSKLSDEELFKIAGIQPTNNKPGIAEDVAKSAIYRGLPEGLTAATPLGLGLNITRGVSDLVRGGERSALKALTGTDLSGYNPNPIPSSSQALKYIANKAGDSLYEPQTIPGQYANTITQFAAGGKAMGIPLASSIPSAVVSETAGQVTKDTPYETAARTIGAIATPYALASGGSKALINNVPTELQPLAKVLPEAEKGTGFFAKKPSTLAAGLDANKAISKQYSIDSELHNQLYQKATDIGSTLSVKAPELYNHLDDTVSKLKNQVATGSDEHVALGQLEDIASNLKEKYAPPSKGNLYYADSSTTAANPSGAYAISPTDALTIRRVINEGLSSKNAIKAGGAKLLDLKGYVSDVIDRAGELNPEFKQAADAAQEQTAKMGLYKSKAIRPIWNQKEDYVPWKAFQNGNSLTPTSDTTISRANNFLSNVNSKNAGTASALAKILPPDTATRVLRQSIVNAKAAKPTYGKALLQLVISPSQSVKTAVAASLEPSISPLQELGKQLEKMQTTKRVSAPVSQRIQNIPPAQIAALLAQHYQH